MKTIILFLSLVLSASAATLYPVMTDNANRTFSGGATNLAMLSGTNVFSGTNTFNTNTILGAAKLQDTLDGKPTVALTNVARLDQSQVFTGTPTFPAAVFSSNKIGMRLLFSTNIYVPTIAVVASDKTNNGDYQNVTQLFTAQIPALLSSNSQVCFSIASVRTNVNSVAATGVFFTGANTNFVLSGALGAATTAGKTVSAPISVLFQNWISFTNQLSSSSIINYPSNFVDTSSTWTLYMGFYVLTTAYTNYHATISFYEAPGE